ncbi:hypothetical protein AYO36_15900 [Exiguobacterium sp. KKBO11]|uniref:DUF4062 domain-containing protein n=1 Tax=Exiguobacterium sp. KKBO11 TaxID=1805000 RepID=UPI0007D74AA7|nr:DUF4062 domain-containing protein [Exiguobacterium sp. KKBO11]OAI82168.1 hypothetical protein AYO36_15900 [Exiguobacterium sp. KKBO11]
MKKKFQVFISSTYTDLIEERQQAVTAVLDSNHIPAGMELFKANNQDQMNVIRQWIDESDVFMLILGGRYGSLDPATQKSYTHLEYEYALEKQMPIFTLILTDKMIRDKYSQSNRPMKDFREVDNPEKHATFVEQTKTGSVIKYLDSIYQIDAAVMGSLKNFESDPQIGGWVRSESIPSNNLENLELENQIISLENELTSLKAENTSLKQIQVVGSVTNKSPMIAKEAKIIRFSVRELGSFGFQTETTTMYKLLKNPFVHEALFKGINSSDRSSNKLVNFLIPNVVPFLQEFNLVDQIVESTIDTNSFIYRLNENGRVILSII